MAGNGTKRRLAAIMAADVVGYSRLIGRDEADTLARLKAVRQEVIDPVLHRSGWRQHHLCRGRPRATGAQGAQLDAAPGI